MGALRGRPRAISRIRRPWVPSAVGAPPIVPAPATLHLAAFARTTAALTDEVRMTLLLTDAPRTTVDVVLALAATATTSDEARTTIVLTDAPRVTLTLTDGPPQDVTP